MADFDVLPKDEREALARLLAEYLWCDPTNLDRTYRLVDRILAAGYTRGDSAAMREALVSARDAIIYGVSGNPLAYRRKRANTALARIDAALAGPAPEPAAPDYSGRNEYMTLQDYRSGDRFPGMPAPEPVANEGWTPLKYARQLAASLSAKHFPEVPQWEPMSDLMGLLSQIDNMTTALVRAPEPVGPVVTKAEIKGDSAAMRDLAGRALRLFDTLRTDDPHEQFDDAGHTVLDALIHEADKIRAALALPAPELVAMTDFGMSGYVSREDREYDRRQQEALENLGGISLEQHEAELTALRAALALPAPEPVAPVVDAHADEIQRRDDALAESAERNRALIAAIAERDAVIAEARGALERNGRWVCSPECSDKIAPEPVAIQDRQQADALRGPVAPAVTEAMVEAAMTAGGFHGDRMRELLPLAIEAALREAGR
jgi:hypothetical protein